MEEVNDRFCVLYANKVYCNCKMKVVADGNDSNAFAFAMKIYAEAREFAERIYEADREEERAVREKYSITPYGYCLSIEVAELCERLYIIIIRYSFFTGFPGGRREEGERTVLFDEKNNRPVSPDVLALIEVCENKKVKLSHPVRISAEKEDIVFFLAKGEKRLSLKAFESAYLKLFP